MDIYVKITPDISIRDKKFQTKKGLEKHFNTFYRFYKCFLHKNIQKMPRLELDTVL